MNLYRVQLWRLMSSHWTAYTTYNGAGSLDEGMRPMTSANRSGHIWPDRTLFNGEVEWDRFVSNTYWSSNYAVPYEADLTFTAKIRDFFADRLRGQSGLSGVDVGAGPNLYPALAMLPFCGDLTLIDLSAANIDWLTAELAGYGPTWDPFWSKLAESEPYRSLDDPRGAVRGRVRAERGSVFDLPRERWDVGSMFFVAESISAQAGEFRSAVSRFIGSLKPDAPFAAAFMENSVGWSTGAETFPAVEVTEVEVVASMEPGAKIHEIFRLPADKDPIRSGYTGMILVCGTRLAHPGG